VQLQPDRLSVSPPVGAVELAALLHSATDDLVLIPNRSGGSDIGMETLWGSVLIPFSRRGGRFGMCDRVPGIPKRSRVLQSGIKRTYMALVIPFRGGAVQLGM
jgi:hypothetical protein